MCRVPFEILNGEIVSDEVQNTTEDKQHGRCNPQFHVLGVEANGKVDTLRAEQGCQADHEVVETAAQGLFPLFLKHKAFLIARSLPIFQQYQALTNPAIFKYPG